MNYDLEWIKTLQKFAQDHFEEELRQMEHVRTIAGRCRDIANELELIADELENSL